MNINRIDVVTLGADVGGKDAYLATNEYVLALRKLLSAECQGFYSDIIKEFALVLRIDGSVQKWGKRGVDNVVINNKKSCATADIFVPIEIWLQGDKAVTKKFIGSGVLEALTKIKELAERNKIIVEFGELYRDAERAVDTFMKQSGIDHDSK
jgi:hypothetical protein